MKYGSSKIYSLLCWPFTATLVPVFSQMERLTYETRSEAITHREIIVAVIKAPAKSDLQCCRNHRAAAD